MITAILVGDPFQFKVGEPRVLKYNHSSYCSPGQCIVNGLLAVRSNDLTSLRSDGTPWYKD